MAVARQDFALAVEVTKPVRDFDRNSACQCHIALMIQQALAGQMDCDQGGGARGLHGKTGTRQVELIGHARSRARPCRCRFAFRRNRPAFATSSVLASRLCIRYVFMPDPA